MSKVSISNKKTGDKLISSEFNHVKTVINSNADDLENNIKNTLVRFKTLSDANSKINDFEDNDVVIVTEDLSEINNGFYKKTLGAWLKESSMGGENFSPDKIFMSSESFPPGIQVTEVLVTVDNLPNNVNNIMVFVDGKLQTLYTDYTVVSEEDKIVFTNPIDELSINVFWFIDEIVYENRAPSKNSNLAVKFKGTTSLMLKWTSGGGNANQGSPDRYAIYYSRTELTEDNFLQSTRFVINLADNESYLYGDLPEFHVSGLEPNTEYYFVVVSEKFNSANVLKRSKPSNILNFRTESVFAAAPSSTLVSYQDYNIVYYQDRFQLDYDNFKEPFRYGPEKINDGKITWDNNNNLIDSSEFNIEDPDNPLGGYFDASWIGSRWQWYNYAPGKLIIALEQLSRIESVNIIFCSGVSNGEGKYGFNVYVSTDGYNFTAAATNRGIEYADLFHWQTFAIPDSIKNCKYIKIEFDTVKIQEIALLGSPLENIIPNGEKLQNSTEYYNFDRSVGSNIFLNDDIIDIHKQGSQHRIYNNWNWLIPNGEPWYPQKGKNLLGTDEIRILQEEVDALPPGAGKKIEYQFESQRVTGSIDADLTYIRDIQQQRYGVKAKGVDGEIWGNETFYCVKGSLRNFYYERDEDSILPGYTSSWKPVDSRIYQEYTHPDTGEVISLWKEYTNPLDIESGSRVVPKGEDPMNYRFAAHMAFMMAFRYGTKGDHPQEIIDRVSYNLFTNADRDLESYEPVYTEIPKQGLSLIKYLQLRNEPDQSWNGEEGYFNPHELAAFYSAVYDGHKGLLCRRYNDTDVPIYGMKTADPNIKCVLGGLSYLNVNYLREMFLWWDANRGVGDYPLDVLSQHDYHNTTGNQGSGSNRKGICPDIPVFGRNLYDRAKQLVDFRDRFAPHMEVWMSEFGYDEATVSKQAPLLDTFELPQTFQGPVILDNPINTYDTWEKVKNLENFSTLNLVTNAEEIERRFSKKIKATWVLKSILHFLAAGVNKTHHYMYRNVVPTIEDQTNGYTSPYLSSGYVDVPPTRGNGGGRNWADLRNDVAAPNQLADGTGPTGLPSDFYPIELQDAAYGGFNVYERLNDIQSNSRDQTPGKFYYPTALYYFMRSAIHLIGKMKFKHLIHYFDENRIKGDQFFLNKGNSNLDDKVIAHAYKDDVQNDSYIVAWLGTSESNTKSLAVRVGDTELQVKVVKTEFIYESMSTEPQGELYSSYINENSERVIDLVLTEFPIFINTERIGVAKMEPVELSSRLISYNSVRLYWSDKNKVNYFNKIFIKKTTDPEFTEVVTDSFDNVAYTLENLDESSDYEVYVTVFDTSTGEQSMPSNVVGFKTYQRINPPTNLRQAGILSDRVTIQWDYPIDEISNISGFKISRSLSPTSGYEVIDTLNTTFYEYTDYNLTPETTYYYKVRATSFNGDSLSTSYAGFTTNPANLVSPIPSQAFADYFGSKVYMSFDQPVTLVNADNAANSLNVYDNSLNVPYNITNVIVDQNGDRLIAVLDGVLDSGSTNIVIGYDDNLFADPSLTNNFGAKLDSFSAFAVTNRANDPTLLSNIYNFTFFKPYDYDNNGTPTPVETDGVSTPTEYWNPLLKEYDSATQNSTSSYMYSSGIKNSEGVSSGLKVIIPSYTYTNDIEINTGIRSNGLRNLTGAGINYDDPYVSTDGYFPNFTKKEHLVIDKWQSGGARMVPTVLNLDPNKDYKVILFCSRDASSNPSIITAKINNNPDWSVSNFDIANNANNVIEIENIQTTTDLHSDQNILLKSVDGTTYDFSTLATIGDGAVPDLDSHKIMIEINSDRSGVRDVKNDQALNAFIIYEVERVSLT